MQRGFITSEIITTSNQQQRTCDWSNAKRIHCIRNYHNFGSAAANLQWVSCKEVSSHQESSQFQISSSEPAMGEARMVICVPFISAFMSSGERKLPPCITASTKIELLLQIQNYSRAVQANKYEFHNS
jgi:hypothetical protein